MRKYVPIYWSHYYYYYIGDLHHYYFIPPIDKKKFINLKCMNYACKRVKSYNINTSEENYKIKLRSSPTKPLALGNVRHAVAVLVHSEVAHVTEQDDVGVLTLSVQTDAADSVIVNHYGCTLSGLVTLHLSHHPIG